MNENNFEDFLMLKIIAKITNCNDITLSHMLQVLPIGKNIPLKICLFSIDL